MTCTVEEQALAKVSNGTRVCLETGGKIGLGFNVAIGLISLIAVIFMFLLIYRKVCYFGTKLIDRPVDVLVLSLFANELLQALGAVMNIKWVKEGQVHTGTYCTAQGITKQMSSPGVAIATLIIAIYTLTVVLWGPLERGFLIVYVVTSLAWVFVTLSAVISTSIHKNYYTPTPYWCWIGDAYPAERLAGEYFWLWLALFVSILVYVPLFFWARGNISVHETLWWKIQIHKQREHIDPYSWKRRSLNLIAYPVAYTIVIIPLSVVRWVSHFGKGTHDMPVATLIAMCIYGLSGAINAALYLVSRRDLFL